MNKVALYDKFLEKLNELNKFNKDKVNYIITQFSDDNLNKDSSYKSDECKDSKIYFYDINSNITITYFYLDGIYAFIDINKKDEGINYAKNILCDINEKTNSIQVYKVIDNVIEQDSVFDKFTDDELLNLGVPKKQLNLIRSIIDLDDLNKNQDNFSVIIYEILKKLILTRDYNLTLNYFNSLKSQNVDAKSVFDTDESRNSFIVAHDQNELKEIIDAPLEKWRIFLHPLQRKYANNDYKGPVKIVGEAGTGKTVVAMHRAKYLAEHKKKVLFTTFTANLAVDIRNNLEHLVDKDYINYIDVYNIDYYINYFVNRNNLQFQIIYDEDVINSYWQEAINNADTDLNFDINFYKREWKEIFTPLDNMSLDEYLTVLRKGTSKRISKQDRRKVYNVFQEYIFILKKKNIRDIDFAINECCNFLRNKDIEVFDSIVVDELQDMTINQLKFLRLLVKEHSNDMFLVGDSRQRIYNTKSFLHDANIDTKNRNLQLDINYRTTDEIHKIAQRLIIGMNIDNMEEETLEYKESISLTHGQNPIIKQFDNYDEQLDFIIFELTKLVNMNVNLSDICIVARTNNEIEKINNSLQNKGIVTTIINTENNDYTNIKAVKLATMHRIKGLEFRYVFLASINKNLIPLPNHSDDDVVYQNSLDIEKALMYVAITRAQKQAYVLSYGNSSRIIKILTEFENVKDNRLKTDEYINNYINNNHLNYKDSLDKLMPQVKPNKWNYELENIIHKKNLTKKEVYENYMTERVFKSRMNKPEKIKRDEIIGLAYGLRLTLDEARYFIGLAGFTFSDYVKRDVVIMSYFAKNNYHIIELENELISRHMEGISLNYSD